MLKSTSHLFMKIHILIMLQFILGLFGCKNASNTTTTSSELGPFTLETNTHRGKRFDLNYGRVNQTTITYEVKYKGKPLKVVGEDLETNTGLPGIWRVFYLKSALEPALILGSQSLYLVTIENEQPTLKSLYSQGGDFASVQWLDSEGGQPGVYKEVYGSDEFDQDPELSGGHFMAISRSVVLDTKTFDIYPFNTNKEWIDGFSITYNEALAFSPDSAQIVYLGHKSNPDDYKISLYALLSYNFRTGETYAVPFQRDVVRLKNFEMAAPMWVADYFDWKKNEAGGFRLSIKEFSTPPNVKGVLKHERYKGSTYHLNPVMEPMLDHLLAYIVKEYKISDEGIIQDKQEYKHIVTINIGDKNLTLTYGEYGDDLVLVQHNIIDYKQNKELITKIGLGFNAILAQGQYQDLWLPVELDY